MLRQIKHIITIALIVIAQALVGQERTDAVTFSQQGGFYDESFELMLMCGAENHIRYTINGTPPDWSSTLYTEPLFLDSSLFSKSNIYTVVNTIPSIFHLPDDVDRIITIRAAVFDEYENQISDIKTNSYIIGSLGYNSHGLPVISITADTFDLFDYDIGIFVPGATYDPSDSTHTGNFHLTGDGWERTINFEFYEPDNTGVNQQCGLRTHGGASRWYQQKGMRLHARAEYGNKRFNHQFFPDSDIVSFKHLNLHPFRCSNWLQTGGQDFISHRLASNLKVESLSVREVVVFINGEYWGIYTMEESPDQRYLEDHFNVNLDEVNIMKWWGVTQYGDNSDWWSVYTWLETTDLTDSINEAYAFSRIDIDNFIDYILLEVYTANLDWPQNNVLHWQAANGQRFRWIFYDGDGCLTRCNYDAFDHATHSGGNSVVLNRLLESKDFRILFYERYIYLKNTFFSYARLKPYLYEYRDLTKDEIVSQSQRFGFPTSYDKWLTDLNTCEEFMKNRAAYFDNEILHFITENQTEVTTFTIYPNPSNGTFTIYLSNNENIILPVVIYDYLGRRVFDETLQFTEVSNHISLTTQLSSGIYLVKINNQTQRIVIE